MKKAKIFFGGEILSKNKAIAKIVSKSKSMIHIDCSHETPLQYSCSHETDLILFTSVPDDYDYEQYFNVIQNGVSVEQQGHDKQLIFPDFLFITNKKPKFNGSSFARRFDLFEFKDVKSNLLSNITQELLAQLDANKDYLEVRGKAYDSSLDDMDEIQIHVSVTRDKSEFLEDFGIVILKNYQTTTP